LAYPLGHEKTPLALGKRGVGLGGLKEHHSDHDKQRANRDEYAAEELDDFLLHAWPFFASSIFSNSRRTK